MTIEKVEDYHLNTIQQRAIEKLLQQSFADYPKQRTSLCQLPNFRLLAWCADQTLAGHLSVEYRLINNEGELLRIFGIADLCVAADYRNQKVATQLLQYLEDLGRASSIDFLLLLAWKSAVYENNGFVQVDNLCKWLVFSQDKTLGIVCRPINEGLMIKAIGTKSWRPGLLDFMGHIF